MFFSKAQSSDSLKTENKVTFSAYAELFYTYDFNEPVTISVKISCTHTTDIMSST